MRRDHEAAMQWDAQQHRSDRHRRDHPGGQLRFLEPGRRPRRGALHREAEDQATEDAGPQPRHAQAHAIDQRLEREQARGGGLRRIDARADRAGRDRDDRERDREHQPEQRRERRREQDELELGDQRGRSEVAPQRERVLDRREHQHATCGHRDRATDIGARPIAKAPVRPAHRGLLRRITFVTDR
jgi:hypothetical protein